MELRGGDVEWLGGGEGVAEPGVQGQQVHVMDGDIVAAGRGLTVPGVDQRCPVKPAVSSYLGRNLLVLRTTVIYR
jgi:hypothetical protein